MNCRTAVNVMGYSFGAAIVAHLCKDDILKVGLDSLTMRPFKVINYVASFLIPTFSLVNSINTIF